MSPSLRHLFQLGLISTILGASARAESNPIIDRGVAFLRTAIGGNNQQGSTGEVALMALALIKAEVPSTDPAVTRAITRVLQRFESGSYVPERGGGAEIYEAAVIILALANLDSNSYRTPVEEAARYILARQNPNGSWDYVGRSFGDTSISQYAVLGLWEAENAGISIPPGAWDRAASWYLSVQGPTGGWTYHRDDGSTDTVSMTAAGVGSLLICERQLAPYRAAVRISNPLLIPLEGEGERKRYLPDVAPRRVAQAVQGGINWLAANFTTTNPSVIGHSPYYALYGIERMGALADQATLGRRDWYVEGQAFLAKTQTPGGAFSSQYGDGPNTAWGVLFLTKATAKTIRKITLRRLGSGTLIGGRGLPSDLSQISVAGGRVIARPMDGAVEGMLAALEDPRVEDAATALAGLVGRYRTEGSKALRPYQDRFRKLLTDPDQGVRRVAAWSLARLDDVAMGAPLIESLRDPDPGVVTEARMGLELLSRKILGFGPIETATPEEKEVAIARWKEWYEAVKAPASATQEAPGGGPTKGTPAVRRLP